jgi:hypothetical protein
MRKNYEWSRASELSNMKQPGCGSFEARFPDDRSSQYFYWDDIPARRMRPETLDRETALEKAKVAARAARDSSGTDSG